ncbi:hypothetical protein JKP88DRAFT_240917 [Tribonema minus]|uniref:Uncharacterized protein n=1 Tax=Tribonema minus TaxID=303371 RepID=A0A835Z3G4_9STRA|nr:hypothetical protein JKP88DRAFT_240917 [Tribonema minus]
MPALTDEYVAKRKADDIVWDKVANEMNIIEFTKFIAEAKRIEVSDAIIAKQMLCVKGKPESVTVYIQRPLSGTPLIIQGLYPVANDSDENISVTERDMRKILDRDHITGLYWNDFCMLSSNTKNKIIDQDVIATWVDDDDEIVEDYYRRLAIELDAVDPGTVPCVFIAGKTCQASLEKAIKLGLVTRLQELSPLGVTVCEIKDKRFVALEGRPHPSWHLMTGNAPSARAVFKETMDMLNGMIRCCVTGNITPDTMTHSLMAALAIDPAELQRRAEGRSFLTKLLYGDPSGRFPAKHVHLRNVKAHLHEVKTFLLKWQARGMKVLIAILNSGDLYLDLPAYADELEYWFTKLGKNNFKTFMCDGVAAKLYDREFKAGLEYWFTKLGKANFKTFMCDGVAAKLCDPEFKAELEYWFIKLGRSKNFTTFMCNSVAAKLCHLEFKAELEY